MIYVEKSSNFPTRVTCHDPLFLGALNTTPLALGHMCQGRIKGRMPHGYSVQVGDSQGFFKTFQPHVEGSLHTFWINREEMWETDTLKPMGLQKHPLKTIPYTGFDFIQKHFDLPLMVNDEEVYEWLSQNIKNKIILNQTTSFPNIKETWESYLSPIVPWAGGHCIIEEMRTLTAIDVNTSFGGDGSRILKHDHDIEKYWLELIPELIHHIHIRHIAGIILIDLPRLKKKSTCLTSFNTTLQGLEIHNHGLTRGGLWELSRTRRVPSLKTMMKG